MMRVILTVSVVTVLILAAFAARQAVVLQEAQRALDQQQRASNTVEVDVDGRLPQKLDLKVGQVLDFYQIFPNSLKMVYVEADNPDVLEKLWVAKTLPQTKLPTKVVVGRFSAKQAGTAKVTVTYEDAGGNRTSKDIAVTVK